MKKDGILCVVTPKALLWQMGWLVLGMVVATHARADAFAIHEDLHRPGHCVLTNTKGVKVFAGEYSDECYAMQFNRDLNAEGELLQGAAVVHLRQFRGQKNVVINPKGEVLYHSYWFDNGADYIEDGLVRIRNDQGLIGYANGHTGRMVIAPQYACADAFANGVALVAITGQVVKTDAEHEQCVGEYVRIDKQGKRLP